MEQFEIYTAEETNTNSGDFGFPENNEIPSQVLPAKQEGSIFIDPSQAFTSNEVVNNNKKTIANPDMGFTGHHVPN